jgi:peptide deformylase
MILPIAQLGQPVLRRVARPIRDDELASPEFREFIAAMYETLADSKGVGLAAPQVFAGLRVFLANISPPPEDGEELSEPTLFINPKLTLVPGEQTARWEGCLSFPELLVLVPRSVRVNVEWIDEDGRPHSQELTDFPARVVQHEFDHLEGILTLDRAVTTRHIIKASEADDVLPERRRTQQGDPEAAPSEG